MKWPCLRLLRAGAVEQALETGREDWPGGLAAGDWPGGLAGGTGRGALAAGHWPAALSDALPEWPAGLVPAAQPALTFKMETGGLSGEPSWGCDEGVLPRSSSAWGLQGLPGGVGPSCWRTEPPSARAPSGGPCGRGHWEGPRA